MNSKVAKRIKKYCYLFGRTDYFELKKKYKSLNINKRAKFNKDMILAIEASK